MFLFLDKKRRVLCGVFLLGLGSAGTVLSKTATDSLPPEFASGYSTLSPITLVMGYPVNQSFTPFGEPTSCSSNPALPNGLTMDSACNITGTPSTAIQATTFTLSAFNEWGSAQLQIIIQINITIAPPSGLRYYPTSSFYIAGQASFTIVPTITLPRESQKVAYTVSPALPPGMILNDSTGIISGAPTSTTPGVQYVVTATNDGGSTTASLKITVLPAQPPPTLKVLCINQAGGYTHTNAINALSTLLKNLSAEKGFALNTPATTVETRAKMNDDSLAGYQVIVLNNSSNIGSVIYDAGQRAAFQRWLKHGGG